ncbi:DNA cytosine methyltransferase [Paenibacillus sp. FSL L8-0709]|uniref:DNA cytosine methyltransferase n=1 Tax=Paenibacillus sp. FSL L8-0709 TaxID=2975312 RepID=UPI0030F5CFBE
MTTLRITHRANEGVEGETGKLVWDYFRLIRYKKPTAFLMENVAGLAGFHKSTLRRLVRDYQKAGYLVTVGRMQARDFGVPQSRERIFIAGFLKEYGKRFIFPAPTQLRKTVRDAIEDLPLPDTGKTVAGTFPNHVASWTSPTPERLYDVIANPRNQRRGMRRLEWDKASPTITAHIAKDGREFLHPHFDRRLTVRECLRLQGLDDSFVIPSEVKMSQAYRLVGNGVSKPVADALAYALNSQIRKLVVQLDLFDLIAQ